MFRPWQLLWKPPLSLSGKGKSIQRRIWTQLVRMSQSNQPMICSSALQMSKAEINWLTEPMLRNQIFKSVVIYFGSWQWEHSQGLSRCMFDNHTLNGSLHLSWTFETMFDPNKDTKLAGEAGTQPSLRVPPLREGRHGKLFMSALGLRLENGTMRPGDCMIIMDGGREGILSACGTEVCVNQS